MNDAPPATGANGSAADPGGAARLVRRATYAAVVAAASMIAAKAAAWALTESVSVLSSLVDSLLDVAASTVNLLAVRHALTPPDREHRFGHGKAEPLAGLAQAAFITGSAVLLVLEAINRLSFPQPVSNSAIGIAVIGFSMAVTLALVAFQRAVVKRTGSVAVSADSLHYASDLILNGSVIASLVLAGWFGWQAVDPIFALAIGVYILWSALRIARMSLDLLMDRELPDVDRARIKTIAMAHPEVRNVHDLRTRSTGPQIFVQMHLELDGAMPLMRAHAIADAVEASIRDAFPSAEVIIHQDPEGVEDVRPNVAAH
ncbi:MAG: cation diffusion facilitator family transporter [Alphaproteobacteria bacterium]|nr:cation diffusion facilitator family transporter [Alphaproteobacteria bacterium]